MASWTRSNDSAIQTVSVRVPRKLADGAFPDDLYPPTFADAPALTIDRWLKGQTVPPLLHSMRPEDGPSGRARLCCLHRALTMCLFLPVQSKRFSMLRRRSWSRRCPGPKQVLRLPPPLAALAVVPQARRARRRRRPTLR